VKGDAASVTAWYEQLRDQYRPARLEVLFVGESPPDPGANERRFFHAPTLRIDNLYCGVAQGLYGKHPKVDLTDKPAVLRRLQTDGFWLIDAVDQPVNHLPPGPRRAAITAAVPQLVTRYRAFAPTPRRDYLPPGGVPAGRPQTARCRGAGAA
jgi:hypothetical protein